MRKLQFIFVCVILLAGMQVRAQQFNADNKLSSAHIELLGAYGLAGASFDQRFTNSTDGFGYKVGIGVGYSKDSWKFIPFKFDTWGGFPNQTIVSLPLQINYLLGKYGHKFETGIGVTPFYSTYKFNEKSNINAYGTLSMGYRYYNFDKNIALGAGMMFGYKLPGLKMNYVNNFFWQPYLSVGFIFN